MDTARTTHQIRWAARGGDIVGRLAGLPRIVAGGLLCMALSLTSVGGIFWIGAAHASSGASAVPLGDYAGWTNASGIASFGTKTNTHPTMAADYLDRTDGWAAMDNGGGEGGWKGSGLRLVLGVPILPGVGTLAQGAAGSYNQYFATLAQNLVSQGEGNAILRLGWEFNGNWYPWSVASNTDAQNFASFWRQIVNTMRAVPGEQFQYLWNPNGGGSTSWDLTQAYPGNAYVDYVGTDLYDEYWGTPQTPQGSWTNATNESWGLNWLSSFAASQGKPIAIPEWSDCFRSDGHGLGDDPYFINQFANWVATNNVAFTDIFSFNDTAGGQDNDITDGRFPNALAAFKADFGGGSGASLVAPTTTTTVKPPTTTTTGVLTRQSTASSPPGTPTHVRASVKGNTVTISWTNGSKTMGDDVFRDGVEIAWPGHGTPVTSFRDTKVAAGSHVYFGRAYNAGGVGGASTKVKVWVRASVSGTSRHRCHPRCCRRAP
ncbi:MAG TPA: glycosyl hydrolase, partial [Acidimicrobiales bacterium]|nr:glycosyl hydrolase [Acidimicrobiales bacterium]